MCVKTSVKASEIAEQVGCRVSQYEEQKVAAGEGLGIQALLLAIAGNQVHYSHMRFQGLSLTAGLPRDANCEPTASISCDEMDIYNEWSPGTSAQVVMLYEFTKSEPAAKIEILQKGKDQLYSSKCACVHT